jgi:hypothetical protein
MAALLAVAWCDDGAGYEQRGGAVAGHSRSRDGFYLHRLGPIPPFQRDLNARCAMRIMKRNRSGDAMPGSHPP